MPYNKINSTYIKDLTIKYEVIKLYIAYYVYW